MNLVLDLRPPEGRHYRSWDQRLATVARLAQPDAVHALCEQAHAIGLQAILAVVNPAIREALIEFQRWRDVPVWAVVPNMQAFIRDLTDLGMVGAARARFLRLSPAEMVRQGMRAVSQFRGVLKKDFATGTTLVADMELAGLRGLKVSHLFLHPQVTEVALAGGVRAVFDAVLRRAAALSLSAGLVTNNPVRAAAVLGPDIARFAVVAGPANAAGYKMFPDRPSCEALYRTAPARFCATEVTAAGHLSPSAALSYVEGLELGSALVDPAFVERVALSDASPRTTMGA